MKKKTILTTIIIFCIGIIASLIINFYMIKTTKNNIISMDDLNKINGIDAILILGCKVEENTPSMMLANRLEKGIEVYNNIHSKIILSGDHGKKDYDEVNVMKNYLLNAEIDSKDIVEDHAGFSTYDSIYRAKYIFDVKKIIIVTQEYHLYRALYIAKAFGIEAYGIKALDIPYKTIMLKNEIREILSRDKNFFKVILKPESKYLGEKISLNNDISVNEG